MANGFDQNNNIAGQTLDNDTSWSNFGVNFNLNHGVNTNSHVLRNNLSFAGHGSDSFRTGSLLTNNGWQVLSPAPGTGDVLSVDYSLATGPRRDDGGLPDISFMRPIPTGRLVNQGVNYGNPFIGSAPEIGVFESPEW